MLKNGLRELIPKTLQVPVKYIFNSFCNQLEIELKILPWLVKPGDTVLDIGGNRGIYAYSLWRLGAKVEVFEPNPVCASVLVAWAANKNTVHVHEIALSNQEGVAHLHIPVDAAGTEHDASASLEHNDFSSARDQQVVLKSLDSFNFEKINFIKIDVEGHEYKVLQGAQQALRFQQPALMVEIEQRHCQKPINEIFSMLEMSGYQGYFLDVDHLTSIKLFDVGRDQNIDSFLKKHRRYINNFLFLHQDRVQRGDYAALFQTWGSK